MRRTTLRRIGLKHSKARTMAGLFGNLKVGDVVTRMLGGTVPMKLTVYAITDRVITCADWQFDKATGAEIDEYLGWGPPPLMTGCYLDPTP